MITWHYSDPTQDYKLLATVICSATTFTSLVTVQMIASQLLMLLSLRHVIQDPPKQCRRRVPAPSSFLPGPAVPVCHCRRRGPAADPSFSGPALPVSHVHNTRCPAVSGHNPDKSIPPTAAAVPLRLGGGHFAPQKIEAHEAQLMLSKQRAKEKMGGSSSLLNTCSPHALRRLSDRPKCVGMTHGKCPSKGWDCSAQWQDLA